MRERDVMKLIAIIVAALALNAPIAKASAAAPSHTALDAMAKANTNTKTKPHHVRAHVVVRPRYPYRTYNALYPPAYDVEYPGPNAHRECSGGFATEYRASGTVIVPRMNCRWARGFYPGP
jgi:hypothetical protein